MDILLGRFAMADSTFEPEWDKRKLLFHHNSQMLFYELW
jgi:hypothetical protein